MLNIAHPSCNFVKALLCTWVMACAFLLAGLQEAQAHRSGETYIYINVKEDVLDGRIEVNLWDLRRFLDGQEGSDQTPLSESEVNARLPEISNMLESAVGLTIAGESKEISIEGVEFLDVGFGTFAQFPYKVSNVDTIPDQIQVTVKPPRGDELGGHPFLVLIGENVKTGLKENEARHSLIFTGTNETQDLSLTASSFAKVFKSFLVYGINHFLFGFDHVAFLAALLIPAVLFRSEGKWQPVPAFRPALMKLLKIITLFTIAHSITLSLAALEIIRLPERLVEAVIALSIVIVALATIRGIEGRRTYITIFVLGLVHGLGFANVLAPYGAEQATLLPTLLAFNVGVEVGQVIFAAAIFPILYLLRKTPLYQPVFVYGASALIALMGLLWLIERVFDVNVPIMALLG